MAKKIRFPLKLADNFQARTLEELKGHFDLESVLGYYKTGKLLTWLEDRYLEDEEEAVRSLDETAADFQRKLCEAVHVAYTGSDADMEAVQLRQARLAKLRTITDEQEFIDHIDQIAFDQEELADLLDNEEATIYLCGKRFNIPASRMDMTYIGIENPAVHISGKVPETPEKLRIIFRGCQVDNLPQAEDVAAPEKNVPCNYGEFPLEKVFCDGNKIVTENYLLYSQALENAVSYESPIANAASKAAIEAARTISSFMNSVAPSYEPTKWYRYEFSTGQEIELPKDVEKALNNCKRHAVLGDEILFDDSNEKKAFILNVPSGRIEPYYYHDLKSPEVRNLAFSSDYVALRIKCKDNDYNDVDVIKIIDRHSPNQCNMLRVEKGLQGLEYLCWNKMLLEGKSLDVKDGVALRSSKLYFVIGIRQTENMAQKHWLARFDISTGELKLIIEIPSFSERLIYTSIICVNDSFAYLYSDSMASKSLWIVDLRDTSLKLLLSSTEYNSCAKQVLMETTAKISYTYRVKYPNDYLAFQGMARELKPSTAMAYGLVQGFLGVRLGLSRQAANFTAVELSTGKVKTISISLNTENSCLPHADLHVYHSMLYCCPPEHLVKDFGTRTGYKFNLAEESPQAVECKF